MFLFTDVNPPESWVWIAFVYTLIHTPFDISFYSVWTHLGHRYLGKVVGSSKKRSILDKGILTSRDVNRPYIFWRLVLHRKSHTCVASQSAPQSALRDNTPLNFTNLFLSLFIKPSREYVIAMTLDLIPTPASNVDICYIEGPVT